MGSDITTYYVRMVRGHLSDVPIESLRFNFQAASPGQKPEVLSVY